MTQLVLVIFDPEREIRIETDLSDYTISIVLSQFNKEGR